MAVTEGGRRGGARQDRRTVFPEPLAPVTTTSPGRGRAPDRREAILAKAGPGYTNLGLRADLNGLSRRLKKVS
jgi:hypothetical protein